MKHYDSKYDLFATIISALFIIRLFITFAKHFLDKFVPFSHYLKTFDRCKRFELILRETPPRLHSSHHTLLSEKDKMWQVVCQIFL